MSTRLTFLVVFWWVIFNLYIITINTQTCSNGLNSPQAVTHGATGNDIEWIQQSTNTYSITLIFDVSIKIFNSVNAQITTRLHNNSLPSPTLRFQRGKQYQIKLINNLGPESINNPTGHNIAKDPNTTNLHTHGLHIGGMLPGDNVHMKLLPGEEHTYIYNIPCEHSGGLFWYHPHHHGSTETQVSMGAAGAVIIEDDATMEGLPNWYTNMKELIFFITHINIGRITNNVDTTIDYVWSWDKPNQGPPGETDLYLVNGEYQPNICMTAGEWIKFRFGQVEAQVPRKYYIGNDGQCTVYLLARDGVIVHGLNDNDVPRAVDSVVWLAQPSRADVAIFCPGNISGDITYNIWVNDTGIIQTIATIQVIGTQITPSIELTSFSPIRPSYLENLMDGYYSGNLPNQMYQDRRGDPINYWENVLITGSSIDNQPFINETNYLQQIKINTINTWEIINPGTFLHPFHIHINHFQILNSTLPIIATDPINQQYYPPDGYQVMGDWQDTIWGPAFIRFKTHIWAGTITMHCHILQHEDEGAMGTVEITNGCDNSYNHYSPSNSCDYVDSCGQFASNTPSPTNNPTKAPTTNVPTTTAPTTIAPTTNVPTTTSPTTISPTTTAPTTTPPTTKGPTTQLPTTKEPTTKAPTTTTPTTTAPTTKVPTTTASTTKTPTTKIPTTNPTPSPTDNPTPSPTANPTPAPTVNPTPSPTNHPTLKPSSSPITPGSPTVAPTDPTITPSKTPTNNPTPAPTLNPTPSPTNQPTPAPSNNPTPSPTTNPTPAPTVNPTPSPTNNPTPKPSQSPITPGTPTVAPSNPTMIPSKTPTNNPTLAPTVNPTPSPTNQPTPAPSNNPTPSPTEQPSDSPITRTPTILGQTWSPTKIPTNNPTPSPTVNPSRSPTDNPIRSEPSISPSITKLKPTNNPTITPSSSYPWYWCEYEGNWKICSYKLQIFLNILYEWLSIIDIDLNIIISIFRKYIKLQFYNNYGITQNNIDIDIEIIEETILSDNVNADGDIMSDSKLNITILIGINDSDAFINILSSDKTNNNFYNNMYHLIENEVNSIYPNSSFNIIISTTKSQSISTTTTTTTSTTTNSSIIITDPSTYNVLYWIIFGSIMLLFIIIIIIICIWYIKKRKKSISNKSTSTKKQTHIRIEGGILFDGKRGTKANPNTFDQSVANIGLSKLNANNDNNTKYIIPDPSPIPSPISSRNNKCDKMEDFKDDEIDILNSTLQQEEEEEEYKPKVPISILNELNAAAQIAQDVDVDQDQFEYH